MDVQEIEKVPEAITELQKTTVERRVFHFALGQAASLGDLKVVANGQEVALTPHTGTTRSALRSQGTLWQKIDESHLTHFATVDLPRERVLLLSVHGTRRGQTVVVAQAFHAPEQATRALAEAAFEREGSYKSVAGSPERLAALGLDASQLTSVREIVELDRVVDTYQTAVALAMFHPNVATIAPTQVATTQFLLKNNAPAISALGTYIQRMQTNGVDYATLVQAENPDGTPAQIKVGSTTTTFSTIQLNQTDPGFVQALRSGLSAAVTGVRDNAHLGAVINKPLDQDPAAQTQTWVQPEGVIPQSQPYAGSPQLGAGLDIKVKNPGVLFGTQTVVNGSYSSGSVPLKLYNNYVRWVWVYVQYLGANNENLSANTDPTWPDTKYSQSLGLVAPVFTILGIPVPNTNTIDVTLNFPPGAHTARILFCGLGSDINGGGWRQYFPADAYPDRIAPTDEVLFPSLTTGILTIGLTAFALAADFDIGAAWASINGPIAHNPFATQAALQAFLKTGASVLTGVEGVGLTVAAGTASYADIKGGNASNIWSSLLALGSVIPKVIFGPNSEQFWTDVALTIIGDETGAKIANAIPYIGELIAVIEALGDAATLAEVCAETIMSPWVIENEVTLTYPATITINHDPADSTFPKTATSWRLEAKVDGAVTLDPITGPINTGGKIQSDPLVVSVTAPFGGSQIQWSVVFSDSDGHQVGTGVSAQYTNNDPANPPSAVAITIQEILLPITASTVFKRADTTGYATAGYTWSNQITDTGTVLSKGIQQVTGTTVSTLAGVAGLVWEQGDRFYVRGVPVAQNSATLKLAAATNEGYARPPFLLFDAFVKPTDQGNHVLLEPDPTTPAYHVRKVTLDPSTGAPSWDPTVSYGTFLLPVSAAALHSSGRVVAIHTDSGRFGWLKPVATPLPVVAAYSAGHGTQVGLLSSPIALAVTNPGVVLVLEAGASQLAAFDLNGNPVPYFGVSGQGQYTLPLVSQGTYLDLAVDGAGQVYALYYTGDGAAPADYHVDVYTQAGAVLDTQSPGVNVPHLAIDYWRSIYAANYDPLADIASGAPHIDPALTVAEPSLSRFDPSDVSAREPARR
jgi:hypothetical protein